MKALAHPTRLFIVRELSRGERCVRDIREMVGDDLSTVSKHLAVLRTGGLVHYQKRGMQVFSTLSRPCVMDFFSCLEKTIHDQAREKLPLADATRRARG